MTVPSDANAKFAEYAHPHKLVSTDWLAANLEEVVVVESDEDILLYDTGHIPGAVKVDWHADLNDATVRDYLDAEAFAELMSSKGIGPDTTVVFGVNPCNNTHVAAANVVITDTLHPSMTLQLWWSEYPGWTEIISSSNQLVLEKPAVSGRPGPGDTTNRSGAKRSRASAGPMASLRITTGSAPSSPRYCTRLKVNES